MGLLRGKTIQLYTRDDSKVDAFGVPAGTYTVENVGNVLIGNPSETDISETIQLYGRKAVYTLAIPADDKHDWADRVVGFFGKYWHTIGEPVQYDPGVLSLLPSAVPWNKKVRVESYAGEVTI